ncbi:uncharacterized protein LOC110982239 [Acanthaster planci]|uniref:Uncharacterized protein LOC110982239 n=1 Tax=Acanthaster planci TaxID=133434 RepID=A0A8B7YU45_ACAPL|nr:uncharacterized protein LOC110982239 [Acanthaster planci]
MAFWKRRSRGSFAPSSNDRMPVLYLGRHPVAETTGLDDASVALDTLYRNYKEGKEQAQRVTVEVIVNGLVINKIKGFSPPSDPSESSDNCILLEAVKMFFGATDPARPKVFFIMKRNVSENSEEQNECHAFLCDSATAAKTLTLQLVEMFNSVGEPETQLAYRKSYDYATVRSNQQQSREKGLLRSQSLNLPRSRGRQEAVSTLKIRMNVEHGEQHQSSITEANNNSEIARLIAKREDEKSARSEAADYPMKGSDSPALERSSRSASSFGHQSPVLPAKSRGGKTTQTSVVGFNTRKSDSPSTLLRESQLSTVKEQSPSSSPKQSPKERKMDGKKAADSKENQQVQENLTDKSNKRKSVRFADDAEII